MDVSRSSTDAERRRCRIAVAAACLLVALAAAGPASAETPTALQVEVSAAPEHVLGSDGRGRVEYDLITTNAFSGTARLTSVEVRGDGRRLLLLRGPALAAATHRLFSTEPGIEIAPASTAVTQIDVVLPRSAGRTAPRRLTHRITYTIPENAPSRSLIGSTTVTAPAVRVDRRPPAVISSPLSGTGWVSGNGCCADPTSPHRGALVAVNGRYVAFELFAIDWVRVVDDAIYTGDGTRNTDWPAYGAPLYAVGDGTVVTAIDGRPDIPPFTTNPNLRRPGDYSGNTAIIRLGPGRYAAYAHIQRGTLRVRRGQRVRAGDVIGRLGNSGNTSGPHLHFGIQRAPSFFSESVPFEIDRFTLEGVVTSDTRPQVTITGPSRLRRRAFPLLKSVITVAPARRGAPPAVTGGD